MSKAYTDSILGKLLVEIAKEELSIDLHRQSLGQEIGFHPLKAYFRIKDIYMQYSSENTAKDYIDAYDLLNFLHKNYHDDIKLVEGVNLVHYFDSENGNKLSFDDFLLILLPGQDRELRNIVKRAKYEIRDINQDERILYQDGEILLASLFKREIEMMRLK